MQHSILFKKPGYYSAFPLISNNSDNNSKISVIFVSSPFHDHFGENFACVETIDFGRSWTTTIMPRRVDHKDMFKGDISSLSSFTVKSGWRAFTNQLSNEDLFTAGSIGWEKLDIDQKKIALNNGWVVRDHPQDPDKYIYVNTPKLFVKKSKDNGKTWEKYEWIAEGFKWVLGFERGIVLENGTMLVPMYGVKEDGLHVTFVLRSGVKLNEWSLIEIGKGDETALIEVTPNKILAMSRYTEGDKSGYLLSTISHDGGLTWSNQIETNIWGFPAHLLKLSDDRILCSYGFRKSPMGIRAVVSDDGGLNWDLSKEYILRDDAGTLSNKNEKSNLTGGRSSSDVGYPVSKQLLDGSILTVYYITLEDGITHCASTRWNL